MEIFSSSSPHALKIEEGCHPMHEVLDPLVESIAYISRVNGNFLSKTAITAGLPLQDKRLKISQVERASENCGLSARKQRIALTDLSCTNVPCLLVFHDKSLRILTGYDNSTRQAQLLDPEHLNNPQYLSLDILQRAYSGNAVLFHPLRSRGVNGKLAQKGKHWFWPEFTSFWPDYAYITAASVLINCLAVASPLYIMHVYDHVLLNFAASSFFALTLGVMIALLGDSVLKIARSSILNRLGKTADLQLASKIFSHMQHVDFTAKTKSSGEYAGTIHEYEKIKDVFSSTALIAFFDFCFIGVFICVLFFIVGPIAWIPLLAIPLVCLINLAAQLPLACSTQAASAEGSKRQNILMETLSGHETVRALNAEAHMQAKWEQSVDRSSEIHLRSRYWSNLALSSTGNVHGMVAILIMVWGVYRVDSGVVTMGGLIAAMMLSSRVFALLTSVSNALVQLRQALHTYRQLSELINLPTERKPDRVTANLRVCRGEVQFRNVSFAYPQSETASLSGCSFTVEPGQTVGLIGCIGSGKSTFGRLISGLRYPTEGAVLIDGIDTRQFDPTDLRSFVGYLSQETTLFQGSLRENLCVGLPHLSNEEIEEACAVTGLDSIVKRHPAGYNMQVGENGNALSGGQRQCVALTRILLRKPRILFLDEPSSQLDFAAEQRLLTGLKRFNNGSLTLILSTHRTSLLRLTTHLIALDQGHIVADGPTEDVMQQLQQPFIHEVAQPAQVPIEERLRA
ncbi:type I secretion system permease/ATPase [Pseudovibrio sp. Tun.PSC04-5.I4]|uniref:type I secretion system permease/ATPase n=1 Tax=Pseudovibrio sp. Tun.PSC04-5.I4 TaxID=1798213 RepID=UPI00088176B1|nr:type I secretion system permease/ATPase [Pseudovibrio sp. Tun.PSC04-5.I4]SDQ76786.1 ATP-binding cassette, subfamily C, LapB [Pseudovibrio sp. Tun.PSC04-5.I4]